MNLCRTTETMDGLSKTFAPEHLPEAAVYLNNSGHSRQHLFRTIM
jgi:hypothetical protein